MRRLNILSGAGINMSIAAVCPEATELSNFTYQKVSKNVYDCVNLEVRSMFSPESFDYILGGLLTINLVIERTKEDLKRFHMDPKAFSDLFRQSHLQNSIGNALDEIENKLTVSLNQMLSVVNRFDKHISRLLKEYDEINYFTLNFDGLFDHIIYGPQYSRGGIVTDFWNGRGDLIKGANAKFNIFHLHGDLRYKPTKKTQYHTPPYRWPVIVVGDQEVKRGIIAGHEALRFYMHCFNATFESRRGSIKNNLAIIGFGFREEDNHIVLKIKEGLNNKIFDSVSLYSPEDKLSIMYPQRNWMTPGQGSLVDFLDSL